MVTVKVMLVVGSALGNFRSLLGGARCPMVVMMVTMVMVVRALLTRAQGTGRVLAWALSWGVGGTPALPGPFLPVGLGSPALSSSRSAGPAPGASVALPSRWLRGEELGPGEGPVSSGGQA